MNSLSDCQRPHTIPDHWIGARKDWEDSCTSFGEALVSISQRELATHALVIGATGSGKTNFLHHLIAQDLQRGQSIVILDARGDLAGAALELATRAGVNPKKVRFFNLREKKRPSGFNPLAGSGEAYFRALGVLDAVAAESESWGIQLAETLRNSLLLLAECGQSLVQLEALLQNAAFRREFMPSAKQESLRTFWERYDGLSLDRQAALAAPVLNKVSILLATEPLRRMFGHPSPVDLGNHLQTKGSITVVSLAVDELHSAGWMAGSILLSSVCREIFAQVEIPESQRNPVRLYVDEFEHFGVREFESILAEGRRFKLSCVLAHQTLAQLTPKLRSMILGNVGVKVVFRTARHDADILNKDLVGDVKAFDLPSLPVGDAVLWRRGTAPIHVEVNEPLIHDVGQVSPQARRFRDSLLELTPPYIEPQLVQPDTRAPDTTVRARPTSPPPPLPTESLTSAPTDPAPQKMGSAPKLKFHADLEDWL